MSSSPKENLSNDKCPYIHSADCGDPAKRHCMNGNYQFCHSYKFLQECEYTTEPLNKPETAIMINY